ncbi:MAG: NPCBM/NEW2 domain-containing protein [Planctomycetes bacterium]|nr:NPCBM/NEW2 domain-containing protein [Planctomycetota bacterium]
MKRRYMFWAGALATTLACAGIVSAETVRLEDLDLGGMTSGWGTSQKNQSVTERPLSIGGQRFEHGVGTHANSECWITLDGQAKWFTAKVGVDDNANNGTASIEFQVFGDGRELWRSGVCKWHDKPRECRIELGGVKILELVVTDAGDNVHYDHADWVDAVLEFSGAAPKMGLPAAPVEPAVLLTPPAPAEPRIHGPRVCGLRPGAPFLYRIPATGLRPMTFAATGLPESLTLDASSGIITGRIADAGTCRVKLTAKNSAGQATREFRIAVGNQLALTPPMGWNSWYIHYDRVSDKVMRQAADQMIATGMADYGYQYVNIDDCWMVKVNSNDPVVGGPTRDAAGRLLTNKRFPDMKAMTDYIHAQGLKAGIYISPGPRTCAGYEGSYGHEAQDARTFAEWGFDFLKYDWCSYGQKAGGNTVEDLKKPYRQMWGELQKLDRDIVLNLCQYGMGEVWKWGGEVGNCWRTTGDLGLERGSALPGFYRIGMSNARHWEYARPGGWNDPDYILIGWVGEARRMGQGVQTTLTPNEQYAYMSMWSLMAAPLIFSGDMAKLDEFTLNVLCNHEVIEIDQDPLGKQARILRQTRRELVLVKDLEDGSKAVGLFNLGPLPTKLSVTWEEIDLSGAQRVRDLWRQRDIGELKDNFETEVPRHGVSLVRIGQVRPATP